MKSAVTVSLVPEARGGPFVFWDDLDAAARQAAALGFNAIELFPPTADHPDPGELRGLLGDTGLSLAAVGTGAGWVVHKLTLTSPDESTRARAFAFVEAAIGFAAGFGAPVIVGSMQGRVWEGTTREASLARLADGLGRLGRRAAELGTLVLYEPLNRYETNLVNTLADGVRLLRGVENVKLLADLFHMNIEEADMAASLSQAGALVAHLHLADSSRLEPGTGHTDFATAFDALRAGEFAGWGAIECRLSAPPEIALAAALSTIRAAGG